MIENYPRGPLSLSCLMVGENKKPLSLPAGCVEAESRARLGTSARLRLQPSHFLIGMRSSDDYLLKSALMTTTTTTTSLSCAPALFNPFQTRRPNPMDGEPSAFNGALLFSLSGKTTERILMKKKNLKHFGDSLDLPSLMKSLHFSSTSSERLFRKEFASVGDPERSHQPCGQLNVHRRLSGAGSQDRHRRRGSRDASISKVGSSGRHQQRIPARRSASGRTPGRTRSDSRRSQGGDGQWEKAARKRVASDPISTQAVDRTAQSNEQIIGGRIRAAGGAAQIAWTHQKTRRPLSTLFPPRPRINAPAAKAPECRRCERRR